MRPRSAAERFVPVSPPAANTSTELRLCARTVASSARRVRQSQVVPTLDNPDQNPESGAELGDQGERITHPVVAVGASAGGLEALQEFFGNVPAGLGASFVVVQHLSPDHLSMMDELLSRHTIMPVHAVTDGDRLEPDHVYLIPPAHNLICEGERLRLKDQPERGLGVLNLAIDMFFASLAQAAGVHATAVVLSGTGSDGAAGISKIGEGGGIVLVQDPSTAKFDGMPISAIQTGLADVIGSPSQLAGRLAELLRHPVHRGQEAKAPDSESGALSTVVQALSEQFDVDLSDYKPSTLLRRITRRVPLTNTPTLEDYIRRVEVDQEELRHLLEDLLIGVTSFFRDPDSWEAVREHVIDSWVTRNRTEEFRAWVCACSTGEEAYTLAMLAAEAFDVPPGSSPPVRIFATDISRSSLETAAAGVYPASLTRNVSPERLERFFESLDDRYRVRAEIRRTIVFAPHDITRQTPFSRMDLVTCRNMLIYMQPKLQQRVLALLHYALKPGGGMFLGSAEGLLDLADSFRTLNGKARVFEASHISPGLLRTRLRGAHAGIDILPRVASRQTRVGPSEPLLEAALSAVLGREGASGLLVSRGNRLLHVLGDTPDFLRLPAGAVTNDVADMLPRNLALSVTTALHRARSTNDEISLGDVQFSLGDDTRFVDIAALPLSTLRPGVEIELVTFRASSKESVRSSEPFDLDGVAEHRLNTLELELQHTRENLQATIEELETTNEEQQATNEELLASNEELQSTNEELHSVNEELHTVNSEYQHKIEQLVEVNSDLDGLIDSVDVGIIFLSRDGRILRYNERATQVFHLTRVDIGRPLSHIADVLVSRAQGDALRDAIQAHQPKTVPLKTKDGRWEARLALSGRTSAGQRMILTLVDVTEIGEAHDEIERNATIFKTLATQIPDVFWLASTEGKYEYISEGYEELFGETSQWVRANPEAVAELIHDEDRARVLTTVSDGLSGEGFDLTYRIVRRNGTLRWARWRGFPARDSSGTRICTVGTISDITDDIARRQDESDLTERFRRTVLALGDVVYDRDMTSSTVRWRGNYHDAFGYRETTIGNDMQSWTERVHPDDLEYVHTLMEQPPPSGRLQARYRFRRADGRYVWVQDRGHLSRVDGKTVGVVGALEVVDKNLPRHPELRNDSIRDAYILLGAQQWTWNTTTDHWSFAAAITAWLGDTAEAELPIKSSVRNRLQDTGHYSALSRMRIIVSGSQGESVLLMAEPYRDENDHVCLSGLALDLESAMKTLQSQRRFREILDSLPNSVWVRDFDGTPLWQNAAAQQLGADKLTLGAADEALFLKARESKDRPVTGERQVNYANLGPRTITAHRRLLSDGVVLGIDTDVTEQRQSEVALRRRASIDPLTGLWLRSRFLETLTLEAARSGRRGANGFAIAFMDLDGFKEVNDSYDHFVGDELLRAFADRLRGLLRPGDVISRFGGDEFAILVEEVENYRDVLAVTERVHAANKVPLRVGGREFMVRTSIGIAVWDPERHTPESLLRDADVAMYEAKRSADKATVVFDAAMHARVLHRHETKKDLLEALDRGEFELFLQPIATPEGVTVGHEALLRWQHPRRGTLNPGTFMALATETNVLLDLETWVLDEVLTIVDAHPEAYTPQHPTTLSVNATPSLLRSQAFGAWLDRVVAGNYRQRVNFVVEIVEETMLEADPTVRLALNRAREAGIKVAVDDFGTGYSSLSYLLRWPIDVLKLDGAFAASSEEDDRADRVVTALVEMAAPLEIVTVLEGVETESQLAFARAVNVDMVQGYFLGRPGPASKALSSLCAARQAIGSHGGK